MLRDALNVLKKYPWGGSIFRFALENNTAQALPYHNLQHCLAVMYHAYNAWTYEKDKDPPAAMIIAAFTHDWNHGGGFYMDDDQNIDRAINCFSDWFNSLDEHYFGPYEANMLMQYDIDRLIEATRYPHKELASNTCVLKDFHFCAQCIRDADFIKHADDIFREAIAVKAELHKRQPWPEYLARSIQFLKDIKYTTRYGLNYGKPHLDEAIKQLKAVNCLAFGVECPEQLDFKFEN